MVLYSPRGEWGVFTPELFALLGGSDEFIRTFQASYPRWAEELTVFIDRFLEASKRPEVVVSPEPPYLRLDETRRVDVSWVPGLLRHMYGDRAPEFRP
jgi:hypothetical protein